MANPPASWLRFVELRMPAHCLRRRRIARIIVAVSALWCGTAVNVGRHQAQAAESEPTWQAAAAHVSITPEEPMYLSGFGNRVVPTEGTALDLAAKALANPEPISAP